jgi:hypothetical protein
MDDAKPHDHSQKETVRLPTQTFTLQIDSRSGRHANSARSISRKETCARGSAWTRHCELYMKFNESKIHQVSKVTPRRNREVKSTGLRRPACSSDPPQLCAACLHSSSTSAHVSSALSYLPALNLVLTELKSNCSVRQASAARLPLSFSACALHACPPRRM